METTSPSLLERLKLAGPQSADWAVLHTIYAPFLSHVLGRLSISVDHRDDLAQEVWGVVLAKLPTFERMRDGSFRSWLRVMTLNQVRNWRRRQPKLECADATLDQLSDPHSQFSHHWDDEHDRHVFQKLLQRVRPDFAPTTWAMFERYAIAGNAPKQVALEFGTTEASVLQAKSRILSRLRAEAHGVLE